MNVPGANAGEADESLHVQVRNQVVLQLCQSLVHVGKGIAEGWGAICEMHYHQLGY